MSSETYWIEARNNGMRQVEYANKMLGCEMTDRHRMYEEDFNALVQIEVDSGRVEEAVGSLAMANFHVFMVHTRFPAQTSPRFYE